ncbi:hypothetical protein EON67_08885 [archaeon]|nr:MAG: hypothetical protein EON67_08885 [archaeon]
MRCCAAAAHACLPSLTVMSTSNVSEDDICVGWVVDIARHTCLWARAAGAASAWIHAAPPSHATLNTPASPPALLPPYFDCTGAEVSTLRVRGAPAVRLRTRGQSLYLGFGDDASALKWAVYLSRMAATPPAPPLPAYLLPASVRDLPPASPSTVAQLEAGLRTRTEPERHPRVLTSSQLPPACTAIHRIQLYATTRRLFLIGEVPAAMGSAAEGTFRVMEIDRTVAAPDSLRSILREHSDTYTAHTIASVIESIYLSAGVPMPTAVAEASTKWRRTMFSADRSFYGSLPGAGTPDGTPPNATSALPGKEP